VYWREGSVRMFHARGHSGGFQACCVADFLVGRASEVFGGPQVWKPAKQQAWKPALQRRGYAKVFFKYSKLRVAMTSGPSSKLKTSTETTPS